MDLGPDVGAFGVDALESIFVGFAVGHQGQDLAAVVAAQVVPDLGVDLRRTWGHPA